MIVSKIKHARKEIKGGQEEQGGGVENEEVGNMGVCMGLLSEGKVEKWLWHTRCSMSVEIGFTV